MKETEKQSKRAFNILEAAQYVGVSRGTLNNWLVNGLIPFEKLPGRGSGSHRFLLIRKTDLDAFLDRQYHPTANPRTVRQGRDEIILSPK